MCMHVYVCAGVCVRVYACVCFCIRVYACVYARVCLIVHMLGETRGVRLWSVVFVNDVEVRRFWKEGGEMVLCGCVSSPGYSKRWAGRSGFGK